MPRIADNALVKAARLIEHLDAYSPQPRLIPEVEALVAAVTGGSVPKANELLGFVRAVDARAADLLEPLLGMTLAPTMIAASGKRNVIPALVELTVDCRLLPGQTQAEAEETLRGVLGVGDWELEWIQGQGGTRSPIESPLWDAVESFVAELEPGARPAPTCLAGFTDSHWLREAFGTVAYGFLPMRTMDVDVASRLIHSADERVPVEDLELGLRWLRHAARAIGEPGAAR